MDTASKTTNSCHYPKGKTTSFSLLLLPTPNGMGRRRFHAAFILYKTLGYPELWSDYTNRTTKYRYTSFVQLYNLIEQN